MRLRTNGVELEVQVGGSGADVLLLHGFPDTHAVWRHQVPVLRAAGYRTIAPDLRGFGASDKPAELEQYELDRYLADLIGILDELAVPRVHVVGHDWGSSLGQLFAAHHPDRVASLTSLSVGNPAAIVDAGLAQREKSWYFLFFQFHGIAERWLAEHDFANARDWLAGHPDLDEVVERLRDPRSLSASLALYRTGAGPQLLVDPPVLPPITAPVLGVWSSDDPYLTERAMLGTEKYVTGPWRYERLDGVGHWLQLEAPDRVGELLLEFLSSH
ncbi:alpha/beta fold hydrolase [Nocardia goodfellowii]|uniref:Pimeloyl-ACP methyl ester carboxylesterase n=1 Tax=Nocardia goodfellowii TaxID=882446 RepID=A0ABS4QN77_9NOCA|nr:alpha/beta fold hydrolase [Nocardia goodfellowii]MBP2193159.1 pimeloyl-ACP methyl ester carboxylesterase [Nocardia goodfellowii]